MIKLGLCKNKLSCYIFCLGYKELKCDVSFIIIMRKIVYYDVLKDNNYYF